MKKKSKFEEMAEGLFPTLRLTAHVMSKGMISTKYMLRFEEGEALAQLTFFHKPYCDLIDEDIPRSRRRPLDERFLPSRIVIDRELPEDQRGH